MTDQVRRNFRHAVWGLFHNWAISVGSLAMVSFTSMWIPMFWVPFIALCLALVLHHRLRKNSRQRIHICGRILYVANLTLIWSALIMIAWYLTIMYTTSVDKIWLKDAPINPDIPYIPILITGPMAVIVAGWMLFRGRHHSFCVKCQIRNGDASERGFIGRVFDQESNAQMWLILGLSLLLSVGEYTYYVLGFITVNINASDTFFFGCIPMIVYLMSVLYLAIRYSGLVAYYDREIAENVFGRGSFTTVRFLVVSGDSIFLSEPVSASTAADLHDSRLDTPAVLTLGYHQRISDWDAQTYFKGVSGIEAHVRFLYRTETEDSGSNIFHFAAIVDNPGDVTNSRMRGQWVTMGTLNLQMKHNEIAPLLVSEIGRIYHITMAWKTYDKRGYRLYDIKHYKPAFRLRDLPTWDVDYNDSNWLYVSNNNEDRPFFRLRKLWRKYMGSYRD